MRFFVVFASLTIALASVEHQNASATEPFAKVGTYSLQFLKIPTSTRNLALGQAGVADDIDPANQYYNPAVLLTFEQAGLDLNIIDWPADILLTNVAVNAGTVVSSDEISWRLAGSLLYTGLHMDPQKERTVFLPEGTGREFDAGDSQVTLAVAGGLKAGMIDMGLGIAAKYIVSSLAEDKIHTWAFDIGTFGKATFEHDSGIRFIPSAGLSVLSLGRKFEYDGRKTSLPRQIRLGGGFRVEAPPIAQTEDLIGYRAPIASVSLIGDIIAHADSYEALGGGVEFGVIDIAFLRVGRHDILDDGEKGRVSYGLGLAWVISGFRATVEYSSYDLGWIGDPDAYGVAVTYGF
ncbi:MAG: PorV/PorQ family protein [Candidatus Latescibacterota bacterium]|nr:MAG: PorV/PorQ family protein [Candidatus Latescibacterota bacterium]